MELNGVTALVTGANRGIGRAIAERLAAEPLAAVLAGTRNPGAFEPITPPAGGAKEVRPVAMDLSSKEAIDRSCDGLGAELADIGLLVNNAGQFAAGLLEEQDLDQIYAVFQVNLIGQAHLCHRLLPAMLERGRGKIVNNASIVAYANFPGVSTYAASKAGVVALTESLRRELRDSGVSAMHLATPGVDTEMLDEAEAEVGRYADTSSWTRSQPEEWAEKVVAAIRSDDDIVGPGGRTALAKLASRGPAWIMDKAAARTFSRNPRS